MCMKYIFALPFKNHLVPEFHAINFTFYALRHSISDPNVRNIESYEALQEKYQRLRNEMAELKRDHQETMTTLTQLNMRTIRLSEENVDLREENSRLHEQALCINSEVIGLRSREIETLRLQNQKYENTIGDNDSN